MTNHLWQSTLFGAVAWVVAVGLRGNRAAVRYWVWFCASVKFLVPFAVLMGVGSYWHWAPAAGAVAPAKVSVVVERIAVPFDPALPMVAAGPRGNDWMPIAMLAVWACGVAGIALTRMRGWLRVGAAVRASTRLEGGVGMSADAAGMSACATVRSAPGVLEPGVVGVWRPVLLLPEGIAERLSPAQLEAVLAHELCHVRRRDNLLASIHMIVEAVFWFHPLVWWIGARLMQERELACDEEVLKLGSEPRVYADGILNVCKLYVESPLRCVAGVTGADIKKRIEAIMSERIGVGLSLAKKLALAGAAVTALAIPFALGVRAADSPKFEVASIKPNNSGAARTSMAPYPEGRLTAENNSLKQLIRSAYGVKDFQIEGGPRWLDVDRYDIVAKAEGSASRDELMLMLQSLLADRFTLTFHRDTKQLPVYNMVAAKKGQTGPNISAHKAGTGEPRLFPILGPPGRMNGSDATMQQLAAWLSGLPGDRPVLDRTGLTGTFDFTLVWTPDPGQRRLPPGVPPEVLEKDPNRPPADGPSLFTAIQEQLGLRLESGRGPVEIMVIDGAEKPSEN